MPQPKPEKLEMVNVGQFDLLNSGKVRRVLAFFEARGIEPTEEMLLAEYDKLGGAVKLKERKLATGTFYDFANKKPKAKPDVENLSEEHFEDEYVLVRKKREPEKKASHKELVEKIKRIRPKEYTGEESYEGPKPRKTQKGSE